MKGSVALDIWLRRRRELSNCRLSRTSKHNFQWELIKIELWHGISNLESWPAPKPRRQQAQFTVDDFRRARLLEPFPDSFPGFCKSGFCRRESLCLTLSTARSAPHTRPFPRKAPGSPGFRLAQAPALHKHLAQYARSSASPFPVERTPSLSSGYRPESPAVRWCAGFMRSTIKSPEQCGCNPHCGSDC